MKQKILSIFFVLALCLSAELLKPSHSQAATHSCLNPAGFDFVGSSPATEYDDSNAVITFTLKGLSPNASYTVFVAKSGCEFGVGSGSPTPNCPSVAATSASSNAAREATFTLAAGSAFPDGMAGPYSMWVVGPGTDADGCKLIGSYTLVTHVVCTSDSISVSQNRGGKTCVYEEGIAGSCLNAVDEIKVSASGLRKDGSLYNGEIQINPSWVGQLSTTVTNGSTSTFNYPALGAGGYSVAIEEPGPKPDRCSKSFNVSVDCEELCVTKEELDEAENLGPDKFSLCDQINNPTAQQKCLQCSGGEDGTEGIWTAIGCISKEPQEILGRFIRLGISMGGGIALLMILSAGFTMTISQGNAQKTAQAKEMMTAAVTGLLFIIFSVTILQFIGYSILKIPGFGG
ncbi:MAG: hypothetical protein GW762_02725 [Candidatus Pacebacteria bacterium]|nr:hypothetical protein [Candidatus Paceibacterota bacterium]PIR64164.1 MAG: hypothetical protein COU64_00410 [Candidatus Pacebacteria bacterium CG10_big_fil_rev_8_21_14_0_10_40_26]PIZ79312.1 MAG: hypothetical protein COY01_02710 [Candidatus Pacebacteria bacterium CG_4_10_14_0_2_um_filter_40_20]PJA68968.1 MAG: hypothetical protein CO156_03320 [Candidatus Pacebacteria bacterium CG_4_9_14_3_um_filter_40_12]PJC42279.1 MAG: hypothetical protein CO041_01420 [Candidatus Pacebacteria bacterium CG_4_9_